MTDVPRMGLAEKNKVRPKIRRFLPISLTHCPLAGAVIHHVH